MSEPTEPLSESPAKPARSLSAGRMVFFLVVLGGLAWFGRSIWLEMQFDRLSGNPAFPPDQPVQLWTHRGHWGGNESSQNTQDSIAKSEKAGFSGTEIDIWWVAGKGFLVGHDPSDVSSKVESPVELAAIFDRCDSKTFRFWLDMKWLNQPGLSADRISEGATNLQTLIEKHQLKDRIFVEASNPTVLAGFCEQCPAAHGVLWLPDWERMPNPIRVEIRRTLVTSEIRIVSRPIDSIQGKARDPFAHLTRFYYTAKSDGDLAAAKNAGASVILVSGQAAEAPR